MSRNVPSPLQVILDAGLLHPALLVKLTLGNGTVYGHTSWDTKITYSGVDYLPNEGVSISGISSNIGASVDNSELKGATNQTRLDEDDFDNRIWRFAKYEVLLIDAEDSAAGEIILQVGTIGKITVEDGRVQVELLGLTSSLKGATGELSSKECPISRFGDGRCGKSLAGTVTSGIHAGKSIQATRTVSSVASETEFTVGSETALSHLYTGGYAEFQTGPNVGQLLEIKEHTNVSGSGKIVLRLPAAFPVTPGESVKLTLGCNRKLKYDDVSEARIGCTCQELNNAINHRGQHYLPGNDKIGEVSRVAS